MGNLFDELKKAKLIDEKKAKRLAHEQRVERTEKGGDRAMDAERNAKAAELEQRRAEARGRDREREKARQREEQRRAELAMIGQQVASKAIASTGGRRWHFVTPTGFVPYLPVDETTARRLEGGELAIVVDPRVAHARYLIVPREVATKLEAHVASSLCFLAGR
ncbi:MAG: DUF2058 family protein [Planctomycetes bacterium]|nr:DUF2058 family protein [Planctomycetota bacterium]